MPDDHINEWKNLNLALEDLGGSSDETRRKMRLIGQAIERLYRAELRSMKSEGAMFEKAKSVAITVIITAVTMTVLYYVTGGKIHVPGV